MSKILDASCVAQVVTVEGKPVATAVIQSQGTSASNGVLLMEGDKQTYIASNASDISDLITAIGTLIDQIIIISTTLDGVSTSPGTTTAAIANLGVLKTTFLLQKDLLK